MARSSLHLVLAGVQVFAISEAFGQSSDKSAPTVRSTSESTPATPPVAEASTAPKTPKAESRWIVTVECDVIMIPSKLAAVIVPQLEDEATTEKAWEALQPGLRSGAIVSVAHLLAKGMSGEKIDTGENKEIRYPFEYGPADDPAERAWPPTAIAPGKLSTQKLGPSLSVLVEVSPDEEWITTACKLDETRKQASLKFEVGQSVSGQKIKVEQPVFHTVSSTSVVRSRNNKRVLVSAQAAPGGHGCEVFLLKAMARKNEEAR